MSIRSKLLLPLALLVVVSAAFLFGYWLPDYASEARERALDSQRAHLRALAPALVEPLLKGELSAVYEVLDAQGRLHPHWWGLSLTDEEDHRLYPLSEPVIPDNGGLVALSEPVTYADIHLATLELQLDLDGLIAEEIDNARDLNVIMLASLICVTLLIAILQDRMVRYPLRSLAAAAGEIRRGNFNAALPEPGDDEIGELVTAFQAMRSSIRDYQGRLRNDALRLGAVLDNVVDGIVSLDERGVIESINPAALTIFGYGEGQLEGATFPELLAEPHRTRYRECFRRYAERGDASFLGQPREVEGITRQGLHFPMDLALGEMRLEGRILFTAVVRDITDRKAVERMQKEFISTVSHELRTPLTSIRGSLGLLGGGALGRLPSQAQELLEIANSNTSRLIRLINDILDIEKIESGRIEMWIEPVNLSTIVAESVRTQHGFAEFHQVHFEIAGHVDALYVDADADRLGQVVLNLLSNAAKFSPPGGTVEVAIKRTEDAARVEVSDRGPGIPKEFRTRIFTRFAQADSSDSRTRGGTGLGLSICKALVERMHGEIGFDSRPHIRTTFFVELPLSRDLPDTARNDPDRSDSAAG